MREQRDKPAPPRLLNHLDFAVAALTFGMVRSPYTRTSAPCRLLGDCSEFQRLAYTLGMTHTRAIPSTC
jgi:hypothetical protein